MGGPTELLVVLLVIVVLFLPRRLPKVANALGEAAGIVRRQARDRAE